MPTQTEIEYTKQKYQGFTLNKLKWSALIGTTAGLITLPLELIKVRSQLLQEGRIIHGFDTFRGVQTIRTIYEIYDSGNGIRSFYKGLDTMLVRSLSQSVARTFFFCNIYNYINIDPRSNAL
jgi:hypothetical protein